ncbi:MAG TPA: type I-E CRISPR-associated endonuclease Cas1e, partial [Anaerolineae bacterium]|nr:type I-E CRISPR-associated endonuclease Cas1e [Anaerolineae bacterium]
MWWLADVQDVHRIEDRLSTLYVEHSHVDRSENAVVLVNRERKIHVPAAMVASLLLGPGTRVTAAAMRLLADSGTAVCWVGDHAVRMYAAGIGLGRGSQILLRQAYLVTRSRERVRVARRMYAMRFPDEDVSELTMQQLRGREGTRVKRLYRQNARRTGVRWIGREYRAGEPYAAGDDVNRMLSAGNSCLYGICHAAVVGVGASPGLGFVHTGSAVSFVLDVADLYKAEYTIPLAFDLVAAGQT